MQWLQLILALSILVVIHELGHFIFAKLFKVRVEKFYMFFNPKFSLVRAKKINGKWQVKFFAPNVESASVPVLDADSTLGAKNFTCHLPLIFLARTSENLGLKNM